jgi:hypothetical protein
MEDVRSSSAREFVFRIDRFQSIKSSGHEIPRPKAALVVGCSQQVLFSRGEQHKSNLTSDALSQIEARLLMCITLAGKKAAPVVTAKTSWIDHPAQSYYGLTGFAAGTSPAQQYPLVNSEIDPCELQDLFTRCGSLSGGDEAVLRLAVGRLRRSRLHETPADRAIDLGTALEILTLQNNADQELSFRASLRAACLLGKDQDSRMKIFGIARAAYDARSTAVHTGVLKKEKLIDALEPADCLCSDLAKEMVRRGSIPDDWDAVVMSD